jgi:uncharacterized protein (TIGR03086 family)
MTETIDIFRARASRFSAVASAAAGHWDAPSPCADWTAGDVVRHVIETEQDFLNRHGLTVAAPEGTDPAQAGDEHLQQVLTLVTPEVAAREFDGYFGPSTIGDTLADFYGWDLAVHAWDLASATGQPDPIDDAEAEALLKGAEGWGDALYSEGVCGPAKPVSPDAGPVERLLATLGRDPHWTAA